MKKNKAFNSIEVGLLCTQVIVVKPRFIASGLTTGAFLLHFRVSTLRWAFPIAHLL
jgi:hypothetical protein